jgi:C4-dicarboxylate-specific signal transduction histidine kinase
MKPSLYAQKRNASHLATCTSTGRTAPIVINDQVVGVAVGLRDITEVQRLRQIQEAYIALMSREHTLLEAQVQERTSELEQTNARLHAEINQRKRTEQARVCCHALILMAVILWRPTGLMGMMSEAWQRHVSRKPARA